MTDAKDKRPRFTHEDICREVEQILQEIAGKPVPSRTSPLADLALDSLVMLDVLTTLEERFDVVLNENVIRELGTINRIARVVKDTADSK